MQLDQLLTLEYLGNTLPRWAAALGVVLVAYFFLKILRAQIGRRLHKLAEKTSTELDDMVSELVGRTRGIFLLAVSLYLGSLVLALPPSVDAALGSLISIALFIQVGIWATAAAALSIESYVKKREETGAPRVAALVLLRYFVQVAVWSVVLLLSLENLGVDVTSLIAGLGIGGVAIALALQKILGDVFASLSIALDRPFEIGDFIIVDSLLGTVEHIGIKTTRVRALSGEQLVFSNSDLLNSRIRNFKRMFERRIAFGFGVLYQTPPEKLEKIGQIVREIVETIENARFDRAHFKEFGDFSLNFEVVYYVLVPEYNVYMDIQQEINLRLYRALEKEGVEFAYPTQTLYIQKEQSAGG